jgi:hypothetical protein
MGFSHGELRTHSLSRHLIHPLRPLEIDPRPLRTGSPLKILHALVDEIEELLYVFLLYT